MTVTCDAMIKSGSIEEFVSSCPSSEPAGQGLGGALFLTDQDGKRYVYKECAYGTPESEVLANNMLQHLVSLPCNQLLMSDDSHVLVEHYANVVDECVGSLGHAYEADTHGHTCRPDLLRIAMWDAITRNEDRHDANVMLVRIGDQFRVAPIDHEGMNFVRTGGDYTNPLGSTFWRCHAEVVAFVQENPAHARKTFTRFLPELQDAVEQLPETVREVVRPRLKRFTKDGFNVFAEKCERLDPIPEGGCDCIECRGLDSTGQ